MSLLDRITHNADDRGEYIGDVWLSFADNNLWVAYFRDKPCRSGQFSTVEAAKKCVMEALEIERKGGEKP